LTRAEAAALLFGGVAVNSLPATGAAQTNATIRIASVSIESAAQPYYAKDMGFVSSAGLDLDV
jgi:ABC-type nitrate/sulfonate/bicarbonate transport system substrate-binding protein